MANKPSQSLLERSDTEHPLFNHDTGEVIGTFNHGVVTYYSSKNKALASSVVYDGPDTAKPSNRDFLDTAFSSFQVDKLPSPITFEQQKKKFIEDNINDRPNLKDIVSSDIMLSGNPAFRTDYSWTDGSKKYIYVLTSLYSCIYR